MLLYKRLQTLTIFRNLLKDETIAALSSLLLALDGKDGAAASLYCAFVRSLWERGGNLSSLLRKLCREDDNLLMRAAARGLPLPVEEEWLNEELDILSDVTIGIPTDQITVVLGKSGCGKSTLLKLLMRFYETDKGSISYGKDNVNDINTTSLRSNIAYVTQETFLFTDTIENNIRVAKEDATREEIIEAAKKASIHDFIMSTPDGYDTKLAELGDSISGGEKQRIGIARAFLHDSKMIFLDEPTSNIDSLNEGMILRSLEKEKKDKTIILVSHRKSTMGIADEVIAM